MTSRSGELRARVRKSEVLRELWVRTRRSVVREFWAWVWWKRFTLPDVQRLSLSLARLDGLDTEGVGDKEVDDAPIFLLATGWRTGSTLLQRVFATDARLLLW